MKNILITGANGGIGQALCKGFKEAGWNVMASDKDSSCSVPSVSYIPIDLIRLCRDESYRENRLKLVTEETGSNGLHALINNAAIQIVSSIENLTPEDWHKSLDANLVAPFLITQALLPQLSSKKGCIINIASIHAQLTKPNFSAYATSKAALVGLTRSMSVELGNRVRVNAICPAAIQTPMLEAGFANNPSGLDELASYHPTGCIGTTEEVTELAIYLAEAKGCFLNGAIIDLHGGIGSKLHDPD